MHHLTIYFYCSGSARRRRLARRLTTLQSCLANRYDLRREALDLAKATCESRILPKLSDITRLVIFDGHTKLQEIPFIDPNGDADE